MAEVNRCTFIEAVGIYYRILFLSNSDNKIIVGENFSQFLAEVVVKPVPLNLVSQVLHRIEDLTMGVRTRDYFAKCLAEQLKSSAPCSYLEMVGLHEKIMNFLRGNIPEATLEVHERLNIRFGSLEESQTYFNSVADRLKIPTTLANITLFEGRLLLGCVFMQSKLTREKVETAFYATMQSKLHGLILEGMKSGDSFVLDSLDCLASIYFACRRPYFLQYIPQDIFLNPELWIQVLGLVPRFALQSCRVLALLACHVPQFSRYLLFNHTAYLKALVDIFRESTDLTGRSELLILFKVFLIECNRLSQEIRNNLQLVHLLDNLCVQVLNIIFHMLQNMGTPEAKLALEVTAHGLCFIPNLQSGQRSNIFNIINVTSSDSSGAYWKELVAIILKAIDSRNSEIVRTAFSSSEFQHFAMLNLRNTDSPVHLLILELLYAVSKEPEFVQLVVTSPGLMLDLKGISSFKLSCTSGILSEILLNLIDASLKTPGSNYSWIYDGSTLNCIVMLLESAGNSIVYHSYYPTERPYPNFFILQNCMLMLALITERTEKGDIALQNAENFRKSFTIDMCNALKPAMNALLYRVETRFLESQLREEVQLPNSGFKMKLYAVIASVFQRIRVLMQSSDARNPAYTLRNNVFEMIYRLIPKPDLDKDNISVFITVQLKKTYEPLEEVIRLYTSLTTFSNLTKEIALKVRARAEDIILKSIVNITIGDDSTLQNLLAEVFDNFRVQPHFVLKLNVDWNGPQRGAPAQYRQVEPEYSASMRPQYLTYIPPTNFIRDERERSPFGGHAQGSPTRCRNCKAANCLPSGYCHKCQYTSARN